jgi:hypothetical protein
VRRRAHLRGRRNRRCRGRDGFGRGPANCHVLGYAAATSGSFQEAVNSALQPFVDPSSAAFKDVAAVLTVLKQNYATIAR